MTDLASLRRLAEAEIAAGISKNEWRSAVAAGRPVNGSASDVYMAYDNAVYALSDACDGQTILALIAVVEAADRVLDGSTCARGQVNRDHMDILAAAIRALEKLP